MMVGGGLFFVGGLLVFALLASNGGLARRAQLAVLGQLMLGRRGAAKRAALLGGLAGLGIGAMLTFSGVAATDAARADACHRRCESQGYASSRIGPNAARTEDRATWWVACICEAPDRATLEIPAKTLR